MGSRISRKTAKPQNKKTAYHIYNATDTDTDSSGPLSLAFGIGRKLVRCLANYYYTIASELTILKAKKEEGKKEERLTSNQPIMVRSVIFLSFLLLR